MPVYTPSGSFLVCGNCCCENKNRKQNNDSKSNRAKKKIPDQSFVWHATDPTGESIDSIKARLEDLVANNNLEYPGIEKCVGLPVPLTLGASGVCQNNDDDDESNCFVSGIPDGPLDLVLSINMIHISPWEATLGLMKLAGRRLREPSGDDDSDKGGLLYCYGPYRQEGAAVPSNESFDRSLRSRNSEWGVRNLQDVVRAANDEGLQLVGIFPMPANNTSLVFRRVRKEAP